MGEIVKDIVFSISLFIVLFLIWITLIQYLIKQRIEHNQRYCRWGGGNKTTKERC